MLNRVHGRLWTLNYVGHEPIGSRFISLASYGIVCGISHYFTQEFSNGLLSTEDDRALVENGTENSIRIVLVLRRKG